MNEYRKKPVVVEARQLTAQNGPELWEWADSKPTYGTDKFVDGLAIYTLEGRMRADFGDWIIKGVKGEFYPCKPDIFEATYEPVVAQPAPAEDGPYAGLGAYGIAVTALERILDLDPGRTVEARAIASEAHGLAVAAAAAEQPAPELAGEIARDRLANAIRIALHVQCADSVEGGCPDCTERYSATLELAENYARAVAAAAAEQPDEPPRVLGHPDDAAEEWLAESFEPDDSPTGVSYEREQMINAYHAGWDKARERIAKFGRDENGCWRALEQPAPEPDGQQRYIDDLHDLVRDILQADGETTDLHEWRDRAGALHVCDPDGQPYRAWTEGEEDEMRAADARGPSPEWVTDSAAGLGSVSIGSPEDGDYDDCEPTL